MEDEGEIEYLDEDEDLVQQYVQKAPSSQLPIIQNIKTLTDEKEAQIEPFVDIEAQIEPLLIERKVNKRKINRSDDDSDYDPSEDLQALMAERKKRKLNMNKAPKRSVSKTEKTCIQIKSNTPHKSDQNIRTYENKLKSLPNLTVQKKTVVNKPETGRTLKKVVKKETIEERRQLNIRIPDYDDPLCLPVKAIQKDAKDTKKLKLWNNLCLEHYKKADSLFKAQRGDTVKSSRTIVLRNVKNRYTGKVDTSIYGKTVVENRWGEKKAETFQGTLPKYREKRMLLNSYPLVVGTQRHFKHTYEAILTREEQKEGDVLVVYKPREAVSAVYKTINNKNDRDSNPEPCAAARALVEATCCKVCAPCYQASWRGVRDQTKHDNLQCAICSRTFVSVYNLLSHLNTNHSALDVAKHKVKLSDTLATVVEYHYRCRICQERFNTIKLLRKHVPKHQGVELFKCEVGNHMAS